MDIEEGGVDLLFLDMIKIIVLGLLSIAVADPVAEAEAYRGYRGYGGYGYRGGYGGYRGFYRGKREAVAMPEADADAKADAYRLRFGGYRGYGGYRGFYRGKREAEPLPEAEASADPYRGRYFGGYRGFGGYGYKGYYYGN